MTDRKEALIDLLNAVRAGEALHTYTLESMFDADTAYLIKRAQLGSLDAAKALHEVMLPGWDMQISVCSAAPSCAQIFEPFNDEWEERSCAEHETPAPAWLLAILESLIARESD